MKESKWLKFNELDVPNRKTKVFEVRNKSSDFFLGTVEWWGAWRQYIFKPTAEGTIWSHGCLLDLSNFIKQLMEERKKVRK